MQRDATGSAASTIESKQRHHGAGQYRKVFDARKRRIRGLRGLWERNGRFYVQLTVEDPNSGKKQARRVPLEDAETVPNCAKSFVTREGLK